MKRSVRYSQGGTGSGEASTELSSKEFGQKVHVKGILGSMNRSKRMREKKEQKRGNWVLVRLGCLM